VVDLGRLDFKNPKSAVLKLFLQVVLFLNGVLKKAHDKMYFLFKVFCLSRRSCVIRQYMVYKFYLSRYIEN